MNSVVLIGRLTKKPELNYTANQNAITRFSLAVDRPKKNGEDTGADFPTIVAWNKTAENVCRYKDKGDQIAVMGRIQTGSYKKDGQTIYTTDIIADRIEFIGSAQPMAQPTAQQIEETVNNMFGVDSFQSATDGIPF